MYQPNNIEFRIASAEAISKFKATQAHSFIQVCRREFEFNLSSREVVLLSYERFSSWLLKLERAFINEHSKTPSPRMIRLAYDMFCEELDKIEQTCIDNPDIFNNDACELIKLIHEYTRQIMASVVQGIGNKSVPNAFIALANAVSDYLQHVLIAMHEFNNNILLKREPFICISKFSLLSKASRYISVRTRAEFYRTRMRCDHCFTLKNYTDEDLSDELMSILSDMGVYTKAELLEEIAA